MGIVETQLSVLTESSVKIIVKGPQEWSLLSCFVKDTCKIRAICELIIVSENIRLQCSNRTGK
jgi:hypothetical protein